MKRIVSALLIIAIMVIQMPLMAASAVSEDETLYVFDAETAFNKINGALSNGTIVFADNDLSVVARANVNGVAERIEYADKDAVVGNALKLAHSTAAGAADIDRYEIKFNETIKLIGKMTFEYSIFANANTKAFKVYLLNGSTYYETTSIHDANNGVRYYIASGGQVAADQKGSWHTYKTVYDFNEGTVKIYLDGSKTEAKTFEINKAEEFLSEETITGIRFDYTATDKSKESYVMIDDVKITSSYDEDDVVASMVRYNTDFSGYTGGKTVDGFTVSGTDASCYTVESDETNGTYFKMASANSTTRIRRDFGCNISKGILNIDFDFKVADTANTTDMRIFTEEFTNVNTANTEYMLEPIRISGGKIYYNLNTRGFSNLVELSDCNAEQWYKIKMWIDLNNRMIYFFVDGTYVAKTVFNTEKSIKGFLFTSAVNSGFCLDNIKINMLTYGEVSKQTSNPDVFEKLPYIHITSDKVGNIFYTGEDIALDVNIDYFGQIQEDIDIKVDVLDSLGTVVESRIYEQTINDDEYKISYKQNVNKYDTYRLKVTDMNTNVSRFADFSYCVRSTKTSSKYGTNVHMDFRRGNTDFLMPLIENVGFGMTRDVWKWNEKSTSTHEPVDSYSTWFDRYIQQSKTMNIEMLACVQINNTSYSTEELVTTEEGLLALETFAEKFSEKYRDTLEYISAGNEYDNKGVTPEQYTECLKAVYKGVQATNKKYETNIKVIGFEATSREQAYNFINECLKLGAADYLDVISLHPYYDGAELEKVSGGYPSWMDHNQRLVDMIEERGASNKELWGTEIGWYTLPCEERTPVTEEVQASRYIRAMAINDGKGYYDRMLFYDFNDDGNDVSTRQHFWGMTNCFGGVDTPYSAKKSYLAVANYNNILADADCVEYEENVSETVTTYKVKYKRPSDDGEIYIVWDVDDGDGSVTVDVPDKTKVNIYDLYGNKQTKAVSNGTLTIATGYEPIYIEVVPIDVSVMVDGIPYYEGMSVETGNAIKITAEKYDNLYDTTLYFAEYNNGVLSDIKVRDLNNTVELESIWENEISEMKVMFWKPNFVPFIKAIEIK